MANLVTDSRNYHDYLLSNGFTVCGDYYYKDGEFYVPHYYPTYCCLDLIYEGEPTGCEIEQMLYMALEGGMTA